MINRMAKFKQSLSSELDRLVQFWTTQTIDHPNGGFYGRIDGHGVLHPAANKGVILNTRILWTLAALQNDLAQRAKDYLLRYFWDNQQGGVFWMLDSKGNPVDTKKQVYAQGFAIYALSEYYRFTGDESCKTKAIELFQLLEQYSFDNTDNGYLEAFSRDWKLLEDLRLSEKDANEKKTMNTHLHILEAYTNLYRIWQDDHLKQQLQNLIELFLDKIIDKDTHHLHLFFDEKWNIKSEEVSFGHDIETSWLLQEAAEVLGNATILAKVKTKALQMAAVTHQKAIDADGSILYEAHHGKISDSDRHWWVQAEAMVGFVNAYQSSNDEKYLMTAKNIWNYIQNHIIDEKNGEWHWRTNAQNKPILTEDKVGAWKAPYHNVRALIEVLHRLD